MTYSYYFLVPPSVIDEDSSPSQLSVRENVKVSLICRGRGVPVPRVNWKREDGRPLIYTKTGNHQTESNTSSGVAKRGGLHTTLPIEKTAFSSIFIFKKSYRYNYLADLPGRMTIAQDGEELIFSKISRTDSGAYLCIASNGVPPSVSKRMTLDVECKFFLLQYKYYN